MLEFVNEFNRYKKALTVEVKAYCQDLSIPLEKRWEVFTESKLGTTENYVQDFDAIDNIYGANKWTWYDDFYKDRYAVVDMCELIENISEYTFHEGWMPEYKNEEEFLAVPNSEYVQHISIVQINEFKEEILAKFILSFVHDW